LSASTTIAVVRRRSPLDDRRFRAALLGIGGVPIAGLYVWRTLAGPAVTEARQAIFSGNYMAAAAKIRAGWNPYEPLTLLSPAGPQYALPTPLAWMLQPLLALDPTAQLVVVIAVLQLSVVVFLATALRAVMVRDWQLAVLLVLVTIAFEPVEVNFDQGEANLILLALSGVWLLAWVAGDRWWGGAAVGLATAVDLLLWPLGVLMLWRRRWWMVAGAAIAGLALWLVAVPRYLPEYLFKVAPALAGGTGLFENLSPSGTVARLVEPATFLGAVTDTPPVALVITTAVALASLAVTLMAFGRRRTDPAGRALEAAAIVAVIPLAAGYSWATHLVVLLLPMVVLIAWAVRRRDWMVAGLVAAGWLLIGPGHNAFQTVLASGYSNLVVLRVMAELGAAGITCIWIASLVAMRRSAHRLDAAREYGSDQ
jgi:hypothetical protein